MQAQVVQMFWARVLDRERVPHLLRCVPRETQIVLGHRLGWNNVVVLASPDGAYELDLRRPDDNRVGVRLFRAAVDLRGRSINNLLVAGASIGLMSACLQTPARWWCPARAGHSIRTGASCT
jgi:hypothetical protein